jgi:hypothetical protein
LKTYKIKYALPNLTVLKDDLTISDMNQRQFILLWRPFVKGSINAAMKSGRLVAELIISEYDKV